MSETNTKKYNKTIVIGCAVVGIAAMLLGFKACSSKPEETPLVTADNLFTVTAVDAEYAMEQVKTAELIKVNDNAGGTMTADPEMIDLSKPGTYDVTYTYTEEGSEPIVKTITFTVADTQAPDIALLKTTESLKTGDKFDAKFLVKSVTDPVDGAIELVDKKPASADKGWYTITSDVDTSKVGTYKVTVHAEDKNGNVTEKIINVAVSDDGKTEAKADASTEEKPAESKPASSSTSSTSSGSSSTVKPVGSTGSSTSGGTSTTKPSGSTGTGSSTSGTNGGTSSSSGTTGGSSGSTSTKPAATPTPTPETKPTTPTPTPETKPTHTHNWETVYKTVHHDAVTHEEQEWVVDSEAWDEYVYGWYDVTICKRCGFRDDSDDQVDVVGTHIVFDHDGIGTYYTDETKIVVDTIHHDGSGHYNTYTVTDSEAWDEQVVDYYKCSCGATK